MPKSKVYQQGRGRIAFNMTPMIDCTFLLIIFFMLATQLASENYVQMKLPDPDNNVAKEYEGLDKVIVNVVPYSDREISEKPSLAGAAKAYKLSVSAFGKQDIDKLVRRLTQERREREQGTKAAGKTGDFVVELRADRSVHYTEIEPVLQALQRARLGSMYITAEQRRHGT